MGALLRLMAIDDHGPDSEEEFIPLEEARRRAKADARDRSKWNGKHPHDPLGTWAGKGREAHNVHLLRDADDPRDERLTPLPGLVDTNEWIGRRAPERRYLVPGRITAEPEVVTFAGQGGAGKTYLSLQLSIAIAAGTQWLGFQIPRGRAIHIMAEEHANEVWRRSESICDGLGVDMADIQGFFLPYAWAGFSNPELIKRNDDVRLSGPFAPTVLFKQLLNQVRAVRAMGEQDDAPLRVIIVDSRYNVFGQNENDTVAAKAFMVLLTEIALVGDCPVILVAHPSARGKDSGSGEAGSYAWQAATRWMWVLTNKPDSSDGVRVLEFRKGNYGPPAASIDVVWSDGCYAPVQQLNQFERHARTETVKRVYLTCLDKATEQGRAPSPHARQSTYAPKFFVAQFAEAKGLSVKEMEAAQTALFEAHLIKVEIVKTSQRKERAAIVRTGRPLKNDAEGGNEAPPEQTHRTDDPFELGEE